jgi:hypothetical protein
VGLYTMSPLVVGSFIIQGKARILLTSYFLAGEDTY